MFTINFQRKTICANVLLQLCAAITSDIIQRTYRSFIQRLRSCIDVTGHHFSMKSFNMNFVRMIVQYNFFLLFISERWIKYANKHEVMLYIERLLLTIRYSFSYIFHIKYLVTYTNKEYINTHCWLRL